MPGESDSITFESEGIQMKRIHLVGKSDDSKSLIFAATNGAKRGSFEVPITQKLRELVADLAAGPDETEAEPEPGRDHVRVLPPPRPPDHGTSARGRGGGLAPGAFERATGFGGVVPELRGVRALIGGGESQPPGRHFELAAVPEPSEERSDVDAAPAAEGDRESGAEDPVPTRAIALPPRDRQRLTAAEIQSLLRAGRSVPSVAKLAGATLEWVRRLDETIEMERIAVVRQLLGARLTRDRGGESEVSLGEAILTNLRRRHVRFPERVMETGWSAARPRGKEWRVRFSYRYRDKLRRADWSYDPRTGEVAALNAAGASLGWVASAAGEEPSSRRRGQAPRSKRRS
jgi:Protein of unknown function (DUF3071)